MVIRKESDDGGHASVVDEEGLVRRVTRFDP
jgi:hypothetical protein